MLVSRKNAKMQHAGVKLNKQEFELKKLVIKSDDVKQWLGLLKHLASLGAIIWCVHLIFQGLGQIVQSSSSSLNALAVVIEKLQPSEFLSYIVAVTSAAGWMYERQGKKRLLKIVDKDRKAIESSDPYKGSSGLTETGDTP